MKNIIEARDAKVAELDQLVEELDNMEAGEEFDAKYARSQELHGEVKELNTKIIYLVLVLILLMIFLKLIV